MKAISDFALYSDLGKVSNSSVNESILTQLIEYWLSLVLIFYTKNAFNLTNEYFVNVDK